MPEISTPPSFVDYFIEQRKHSNATPSMMERIKPDISILA